MYPLKQRGLRIERGVAIPKHMRSPGQEGYRTPTGEDYEKHNATTTPTATTPVIKTPAATRPHSPTPFGTDGALDLGHEFFQRLLWKERIRHFTWTFFLMTMATGGIANVLYTVPYRFRGLQTIGAFFFLLNVVLFLLNVAAISLRFYLHPRTFKSSFTHPTESLFIPAAVVSFGTILVNISQYGLHRVGFWLNTTVLILFWVDVVLAIVASCGIYLIMWSTQTFTIAQMTPIWIFPAYPMLIIGPHAGVLTSHLKQSRALDILLGGFVVQGIGFMVSFMIYGAFIYRLMTQKLPKEALRPGMFVSVGPCGFTATGLINMAANASHALPEDFMGDGQTVAMILRVIGAWIGFWIWGLCLWFFFISCGAHFTCIRRGKMTFTMSWYSFVFPNTALVTATFAVGETFGSTVIKVVGCVLTILLVAMWVFVFAMMIRAIILKQILWPQKGEDKDEGGFKAAIDVDGRTPGNGFVERV